MSRLTLEQQRVVASKAKLLAVDAFAGTGKTSTLVQYARAREDARILYIAFNKSVAAEARDRFPGHVECRTTHSLAYGVVGRKFSDKLGNAQAYQVAQEFNCNPRRAKKVLQTVTGWLCTTDEEIGVEHVDDDGQLAGEQGEADIAAVADMARGVWEEMKNPRSALKMPHDGYLKLWAMTKPRLPYDIILLDEAQDTNPLTLELVMAQRHASIVLVGDRHQGIYGFRKAMNAMEMVDAEERVAITQSFRFGQAIADVATALLKEFKSETLPVTGRSDIQVAWHVDRSRHYAILGRTNAGLFAAAAQVVLGTQNRRLHFVGGFESYLFGKVLDAYYLWADERSKIKDPSIARFLKFNDFKRYGEEASDAEVKALVKTVEQYRTEVPRVYSAMRAAEMPVQERSDVTFTTAHKAKGLEWEQVELVGDFIDLMDLPPVEEIDLEEINLLYVGLTRAIRAVQLPPSLSAWLQELNRGEGNAIITQPPTVGGDVSHGHAECGDARENWLRENIHQFGDAANEISFLLERLDQARAERF